MAALLGVEAEVERHGVGLDLVRVVDGEPPLEAEAVRDARAVEAVAVRVVLGVGEFVELGAGVAVERDAAAVVARECDERLAERPVEEHLQC